MVAQAADEPVAATLGTPTRYAPISPLRVLDTRSDPVHGRLPAGGSLVIAPVTPAVSAASGVPAGQAQAVVLNITMVDTGAAGYASVWPAGSSQPTVSSLNADFPAQTIANLVTVPLGVDGRISLFSSSGADYVIDVQGVHAGASSATAGRLVPFTPLRALDTRGGATLGPNASVRVDLTRVGVPADASAAVLNVTATNTWAPGYLTVWPDATPMPLASNVNVGGPGQSVANQVIARVTNGVADIFSSAGADVIVDVSGYVTGASAPNDTVGLYVPLAPERMLDTRSAGSFSNGQPIDAGTARTLPVAGRSGVPTSGALAIAVNLTATQTQAPGYVTAWPANTMMPATSSVNFSTAGRSVPNHAIVGLNAGAASFYSQGGTHLLVDVMGYWTGPPATGGPPSIGPHAFLYEGRTTYGRWNPCEPIDYVVNAYGADQAMLTQLDLAIAGVENATGLDFVYRGSTTAGHDFRPPAGADAVLGFSDPSRTPQLAGSVIGIGGGSFNPDTGRVSTGFALADVEGIVSAEKLRATFLHEIAHMVGLDHVGDSNQLMYPSATAAISTYQNGDREGLWRVGAAQGCVGGDAPLAGDRPGSVLVVRT
jgi:hypothetical protein